jgi:type IV pilus assembly protein PilV
MNQKFTSVPRSRKHRSETGFTLIEVLIAVIVLTIGLLGVVSLQITSKRGNNDALQRATATMLAEDMVERIRANPGALAAYDAAVNVVFSTNVTTPTPNCGSAVCTPAQIVDYDMWQWWLGLKGASESNDTGGLLEARGCVDQPDNAQPNLYRVRISWRGMTCLPDTFDAAFAGCSALADYDEPGVCDGTDSYRRVLTVQAFVSD